MFGGTGTTEVAQGPAGIRVPNAAESIRCGPIEGRFVVAVVRLICLTSPGATENITPPAGLIPAPLAYVARNIVKSERINGARGSHRLGVGAFEMAQRNQKA